MVFYYDDWSRGLFAYFACWILVIISIYVVLKSFNNVQHIQNRNVIRGDIGQNMIQNSLNANTYQNENNTSNENSDGNTGQNENLND